MAGTLVGFVLPIRRGKAAMVLGAWRFTFLLHSF